MKTASDAESHRSPGPWPGDLAPAPLEGTAPSPESSGPFRSVGFTLSSVGHAVSRRFREILAPLELEPREFALLRGVSAAEGQTQHAIGGRLQIPPSRMVAFVDALEARGLLERRLNPEDRRTRALHLTDAGRDLLDRAFGGSAMQLVMQALSAKRATPAEIDEIRRMLDQYPEKPK